MDSIPINKFVPFTSRVQFSNKIKNIYTLTKFNYIKQCVYNIFIKEGNKKNTNILPSTTLTTNFIYNVNRNRYKPNNIKNNIEHKYKCFMFKQKSNNNMR